MNSKSGLNRRNGGVIYRDTLRLVHAGFGLVVLFSFLLTIRRIGVLQLLQGPWTLEGPKSKIPFIFYFVSGVLLIAHSAMKTFTDGCNSGTEFGAECGQMFYSSTFDLLFFSLSHSATLNLWVHPYFRKKPYYGVAKACFDACLIGYVLAMALLTAEWIRTKDPRCYSIMRYCRTAMIVFIMITAWPVMAQFNTNFVKSTKSYHATKFRRPVTAIVATVTLVVAGLLATDIAFLRWKTPDQGEAHRLLADKAFAPFLVHVQN